MQHATDTPDTDHADPAFLVHLPKGPRYSIRGRGWAVISSTRRSSSEGRMPKLFAKLKIAFREGLFSPRSSCPM